MAIPKKSPGGKALRAKQAVVKGKTSVEVNLSGVTVGKRRKHIPEGNYLLKLTRAETGKGKDSNNPLITWTFEVIEGSEKVNGTPFWYRTVLVEQSLWAFRGVLEAFEPRVKIKDSTMQVDLTKLIGRTVGAEIVDGEYDGKITSEINDIFHPSLLEDEEEEEEEAEDEDEDEEDEEESDEDEDEDEEDEEDEEEDEDEYDEDEIDLEDEE